MNVIFAFNYLSLNQEIHRETQKQEEQNKLIKFK